MKRGRTRIGYGLIYDAVQRLTTQRLSDRRGGDKCEVRLLRHSAESVRSTAWLGVGDSVNRRLAAVQFRRHPLHESREQLACGLAM